MSRGYSAKWRRQYRAKKAPTETSIGVLLKAIKLYKRGVKNNDREALLAAQRLLDMSEGKGGDR